ncbi:hypothetical protein AcW1_004136 [Taiwanofungus camphoratus]|nr:hypothetical protein AcW1_004136 [Antrodia cinnamomea]
MLCNWSTTANTILRGVVHCNSGAYASWHGSRTASNVLLSSRQKTRCGSSNRVACLSTLFPRSAGVALARHPTSPSSGSMSSYTTNTDIRPVSLTPAQMSRAAAQAIRLCARDAKFGDALYLVTSLHYSVHGGKWTFKHLDSNPAKRPGSRLKPIKFGRPVSCRLSAHTFLHELLRAGFERKAAKYAEMMMGQDIRIRTSTLNAILSSLSHKSSSPLHGATQTFARIRLPRLRDGPEILKLRESLITDRCTRAAVSLLKEARVYGQQRTQRMYDNVISGCLLQGEIIVASLLFVLVVKDWELQKALAADAQQADSGAAVSNGSGNEPNRSRKLARHGLRNSPYPSAEIMNTILKKIDTSLSQDPRDPDDEKYLLHPLQALANLAMLLDTGQLHTHRLKSLIISLYSCPKTTHHVWILRKGKPAHVEAYPYFQGVLMRVIRKLLGDDQGHRLPCLDLRSYNSLIFYALRHRFSPLLASRLLDHMCSKRNPTLRPNIVTYNILLRSGTILRKSEIGDAALRALRENKMNSQHGIMVEPPAVESCETEEKVEDLDPPPYTHPSRQSVFSSAMQRLVTETMDTPVGAFCPSEDDRADAITLASYVTHLTSTGTPHVVADVLFRILPELSAVDHPSWGSLGEDERQALRAESRTACLRRAVGYGPYVFAVILNALTKARKTGLAERVWVLAKEAERASWVPNFAPGVMPWFLPVHAYTSMLQCYADEVWRGVPFVRSGRDHPDASDKGNWRPAVGDQVYGWARFISSKTQKHSTLAHKREMGLQLYRSMTSGGESVYKSLISLRQTAESLNSLPHVEPPSPDARFFNAALHLFGRHPHMHARGKHRGRAYWRQRLRVAHRWYERRGTMSRLWTPALQEVAEGMIAAGFGVPVGFRHLFIGRWVPGTLKLDGRPQVLACRPYAFPPMPRAFRPFALPTVKTRGLPLRRVSRRHQAR